MAAPAAARVVETGLGQEGAQQVRASSAHGALAHRGESRGQGRVPVQQDEAVWRGSRALRFRRSLGDAAVSTSGADDAAGRRSPISGSLAQSACGVRSGRRPPITRGWPAGRRSQLAATTLLLAGLARSAQTHQQPDRRERTSLGCADHAQQPVDQRQRDSSASSGAAQAKAPRLQHDGHSGPKRSRVLSAAKRGRGRPLRSQRGGEVVLSARRCAGREAKDHHLPRSRAGVPSLSHAFAGRRGVAVERIAEGIIGIHARSAEQVGHGVTARAATVCGGLSVRCRWTDSRFERVRR